MPEITTQPLRISALAAATGTTTPTIRFYESIGLLPTANRQSGGQRRYGVEDVKRLTFIRRCRDFGFSVDQVRALAGLLQDSTRSCTEARDIAHAHLEAVHAKLKELRALERDIGRFVQRCDEACVGGPGPTCIPLTELAHRGAPSRVAPRESFGARGHRSKRPSMRSGA